MVLEQAQIEHATTVFYSTTQSTTPPRPMKSLPQTGLTVLLLSLLFSIPRTGIAQSSKQPVVSLSYFGEFIGHPGFKAGINVPLAGRHKPGKRHSLLLGGGNVGAYYHKGNHTGLFLEGELGYRFVTKGGFKMETFISAGYHRSFIDGPVYSVSPSNDISKEPLAGQNTFLASWLIGLGKQLKNSPVGWHIRPGFMIRTPHNSSLLPHLFIETGISYKLNWR